MIKQLISLLVSLLLLGIIYWKIDVRGLVAVLQNCNGWWLAISLSMVIPLTLLTAWRLQQLVPKREAAALPLAEANRLILAACTLNMVLPSKMGDIAKAYFMRDYAAPMSSDRNPLDGSLSLSLVVFEKACDLLSLLLWCALGLLLYPQKGWLFWLMTIAVASGLGLGLLLIGSHRVVRWCFDISRDLAPRKLRSRLVRLQQSWELMHGYFWSNKRRLWKVSSLSVFIWFLHLLQIWLFILALNAWTPFLENLALAPLAILVGLLPLTFAGVGTRDAALVVFYHPFLSAPTAAALGLLCTSRYLLPAIAGLPFLGRYLTLLRKSSKRD
jgi:glycosyltransferase 2 family protein